MAKRSSKLRDTNSMTAAIVAQSTDDEDQGDDPYEAKDREAVDRGRLGGEKGGDLRELRTLCAARLVALVDALRSIPEDLTPCSRSKVVAVREQIYYGWERPLVTAHGVKCIAGKYEVDGWWSMGAAALVNSGQFQPRTRQLEREHVEPVSRVVWDLLAIPRTVEETADLLDARLITCTVLSDEHRRLGTGEGWGRYEHAGVMVQPGLDGRSSHPADSK